MEKLPNNLQENLISLLCFDDANGKIIRGTISVALFEGEYKEIAQKAYNFIDNYKQVPGEHIADLFAEFLEAHDDKAKLYDHILTNLFIVQEDLKQGDVNIQYIMDQLAVFVRRQEIKDAIMQSAQLLQNNDPDALDEIDTILTNGLKGRLQVFDSGTFIRDTDKSLEFLEANSETFPTGIPEFNDHCVGPARKELFLFMAPPKRGKTWALINFGRRVIQARLKVCHVTLEMSETRMAQRYLQNIFAISKRDAKTLEMFFKRNPDGTFLDLDLQTVNSKLLFSDPQIRRKLINKINRKTYRSLVDRLVIKQFPSGSLSVTQLTAYLNLLEEREKFIPDLLIIDYPDLMAVDINNFRHSIGHIFVKLRGLAVERNIALVTATQANRSGASAKQVSDINVAEDFSKIATADSVVTYSQTEAESQYKLARLYVSNGRNDEDKFTVLISQNYNIGQFVIDSIKMDKNYWGKLEDFSEN